MTTAGGPGATSGGRELEVVPDAAAAARRGAAILAEAASEAVRRRGSCAMALSGGTSPLEMFGLLARQRVPWDRVAIWQVDERIAPDGHPDRNLTGLLASLPEPAVDRVRPMPVTDPDLEAAADRYAADLPAQLDVVHLGLGDDGHTASLVPGEPVLGVEDRRVALTTEYRGRRRMTMTFPVLDRARTVLWLVTGSDKVRVLPLVLAGDGSIPGGRVRARRQIVVADEAAAAGIPPPGR